MVLDKNSYLIILGAGPQQVAVYEKAAKLGLKTVALDYNPKADAIKIADKYILVSVNNNNIKECLTKLKDAGLKYSGVIASGIEVSPLASAIAKEFNLIWSSEETAFNTTNKCASSTLLQDAGIPIPRFEIIDSPVLPNINFPFVVKPSDNSGSRGVRIVDSEKEWLLAYDEAKTYSSDGIVIVEELLQGDEISIEGFVLDGEVLIHGFFDRNYIPGFYPYFMEDGCTFPTRLPPKIVKEAHKVYSQAVMALGIKAGPTKGDLIVTVEGVKVLEVTSRFSPLFPMILPFLTGVDPMETLVRWAVGMEVPRSLLEPKFTKAMAHRYYFHKPGKVSKLTGLKSLKDQPGVKLVIFLRNVNLGDILAPSSYINRPLYLAAIANDRETAIKLAENALKTVHIEVEHINK